MHVAQGPAPDLASIRLVVLMAVAAVAMFWRTMLKLLAVAVVVFVLLGFATMLHLMHLLI